VRLVAATASTIAGVPWAAAIAGVGLDRIREPLFPIAPQGNQNHKKQDGAQEKGHIVGGHAFHGILVSGESTGNDGENPVIVNLFRLLPDAGFIRRWPTAGETAWISSTSRN
jgi:hypothetical protein